MSRYHFHVLDGTALPDHQGMELGSIDIAKAEAVKMAGEVLRDSAARGIWALKTWKLVVNGGPLPDSSPTYFTLEVSARDERGAPK